VSVTFFRCHPKYAQAYNNRGAAYWLKEEYNRAIADYDQAIRLDPKYALAYFVRGLVYQKIGNAAKADADFAKARELGLRP